MYHNPIDDDLLNDECYISVEQPVAIILDKSASTGMIRGKINQCLHRLLEKMKAEPMCRDIVKLLVIQYATDVDVVTEFEPLERLSPDALDIEESAGCTNTGLALKKALKLMADKRQEWKDVGDDPRQPMCFLLTDGYPDPGDGAPDDVVKKYDRLYREVAREIRQLEMDQKITFVAAGIQTEAGGANIEKLRELTNYPDRVLRISDPLKDMEGIERFFRIVLNATCAAAAGTSHVGVIERFLGLR